MVRGAPDENQWNSYELQLNTSRARNLVASFLKTYNITVAATDDIFISAIVIHPVNIEAYLDNVGIFNVRPSRGSVTVSKSTIFPTNWYSGGILVNGSTVKFDVAWGLTSDVYTFDEDVPLAVGLDFRVALPTLGEQWSIVDAQIASAPTWI